MKGFHTLPAILSPRAAGGKSKNVDISVGEGLGPPVSSQPDARTASRARCAGFYVTSLSFNKEVTKKVNQRLPPLETASVPRYKVGWGERHL